MNIPQGICSKCQKDFMECQCTQFYPNIQEKFELTQEEVVALLDYFVKRAGYISHEFDSPVHEIIKRLNNFIMRTEK